MDSRKYASQVPGQPATDELAEAVRSAMMDDIGLHRLEELPMEDGERQHSPRGGDHHLAIHNHRGGPDNRRQVARARPHMSDFWQGAIEAGFFDDDDAEQVKGLDDLGGGRLYDQSKRECDRNKQDALKVLRQMDSNYKGPMAGMHPSGQQATKSGKRKKKKGGSTTSQPHPVPSRPQSQRPPRPAQPNRSIMAAYGYQVLAIPNTPAQPPVDEPKNVVFTLAVGLCDPESKQYVPAYVYLTTAEAPALGSFFAFVLGKKFCEWHIPLLDNCCCCQEDGGYQVIVTFRHPSGYLRAYMLHFRHQHNQEEFVRILRGLKEGPAPQAAPQQDFSATPESPVTAGQEQPTVPQINVDETLINLEEDTRSVTDSQPQSSATELLATLEPYSYEDMEDSHRKLQHLFRVRKKSGRDVAEAIKDALRDWFVERNPAADPKDVEKLTLEVFEGIHRVGGKRRVQYPLHELLDLRGFAVKPPAYLAELRFLPEVRNHETVQSSAGRLADMPSDDVSFRLDRNGIAKIARDMDWAIASQNQVEPVQPESSAAASPPVLKQGLKASLWSTPEQLTPRPSLANTPSRHLRNINRLLAATSQGSAQDVVGGLSAGISRLPIVGAEPPSPIPAPAPQTSTIQQGTPKGLAASRHATRL